MFICPLSKSTNYYYYYHYFYFNVLTYIFIKCINAVNVKTSIKYSKLPRRKVFFLHY